MLGMDFADRRGDAHPARPGIPGRAGRARHAAGDGAAAPARHPGRRRRPDRGPGPASTATTACRPRCWPTSCRSSTPTSRWCSRSAVRDLLVNAGLQEVITYALTDAGARARRWAWPSGEYVALLNPISSERAVMRHSVLAGVLEVAAANLRAHRRRARCSRSARSTCRERARSCPTSRAGWRWC